MALGGLFKGGGTAAAAEEDDFGAIASRVAEQMASTRAASQSERTKKATEVAERPEPTREVVLKENPDGTITRTETVKNAPRRDPQQEIAEAENSPYAAYAARVVADAGELAAEEQNRLDRLQADPRWQTPDGRRTLAAEFGVTDPARESGGFLRRGLFRYRQDRRDYEQLIADPTRLRSMVLAQQFEKTLKPGEAARPFASDLEGAANRRRIEASQLAEDQRMRSREASSTRERAIDNVRQFDLSHMESADAAVQTWQKIYGDQWGDLSASLEPLIRSEYHERQLIRQRAALADARKDEADERARMRLDKQIENIDSLIRDREDRDRPKPVKPRVNWTTSDMVAAAGDETYDQAELLRVGNRRLTRIVSDVQANSVKAAVIDARLEILRKDPAKAEQVAKLVAQRRGLEDQNRRLIAEKNALMGAGFGGRSGPGNRQPATGNRQPATTGQRPRILTKEEAAARLQ